MHHLIKSAVLMAIATGVATQAMAASTLRIERQCDRYGHFCDGNVTSNLPHKFEKHHPTTAKKKTYKQKHYNTSYRTKTKPFIERQCSRYGYFC